MKNKNNINAQDYQGNTALHHAVDKGDFDLFDLVETLVIKEEDVNVQDKKGEIIL